MANTPHGYPYPVGTDRVMDGDDAIHSLATAVDGQLGVMASGLATTPTPGAVNTAMTVAVTFPVGRFNAPPNVTCAPTLGQPWTVGVSVSASPAPTATGCSLIGARLSGALAAIPIYWIAHQI